MIRITSKRAGFRRCGMPHPKGPVDYPDDRFSTKEIKILEAEPMLIVEILPNEPEAEVEVKDKDLPVEEKSDEKPGKVIEDMTIAQLKKDLDALGIGYPDKIRKADLIEVYKRAHE